MRGYMVNNQLLFYTKFKDMSIKNKKNLTN